jgi:hypothetical protein
VRCFLFESDVSQNILDNGHTNTAQMIQLTIQLARVIHVGRMGTTLNVPLSPGGNTVLIPTHEEMIMNKLLFSVVLLTALPAAAASSVTADLLTSYRAAGGKDFSAAQGEKLFRARHGDMSCTTCHTDNAKAVGKHAQTGKQIEALAPVANPARLSDPAKVEKWFKRNCNDVLKRGCTAQEKGDFVTWLLSIK